MRNSIQRARSAAVAVSLAVALASASAGAFATEKADATPEAPAVTPSAETVAAQYCNNIADAAGDARFARQAAALAALERDIDTFAGLATTTVRRSRSLADALP